MEELLQATKKAKIVIVLDRSLSFGTYIGPVCSEVRAALSAHRSKTNVVGFVGGLGGRDITVAQFIEMIKKGEQASKKGREKIEIIGVIE